MLSARKITLKDYKDTVIIMTQNFIVTNIASVIYVGSSEYTEARTQFNSNLGSNELVYHFSGDSIVKLGDKEYRMQKDTLRVMAPGEHGCYDVTHIRPGYCIDIFFNTNIFPFPKVTVLQIKDSEKIGFLFKKIFNLWIQRDEGYYLKCMSVLYEILALMQIKNYLPKEKYEKIAPAIQYISENFRTEDISCEFLAEICGISYSYLKRLFIEKFKVSPKEYIIQARINYACDLLPLKLFNIKQVAEQCGFRDPAFFSREFKKYVGSSPRDFISRHKSSK